MRVLTKLVLLALLTFRLINPAVAEIIKYIDENGQAHFVDSDTKVPEGMRSSIDQSALPAISRVPSRQYKELPAVRTYSTNRARVQIFVTSWCTYCRKLEAYLNENKVAYQAFDIEKDAEGKRLHQQLGGGGVPVTKVGTTVIRGFRPDEISQALKGM